MTINEDKDKRDIENLLPEKRNSDPKSYEFYDAGYDCSISDSASNLLESITGEEELKDICCIHFDCTPDDGMCETKDCRALSMFNMLTKKYIILERK